MVLLLAGSGFPLLSAPCACSQAVGEAEVVIVAADVFLRWYGRGGRTYFIQAADPNGPLLGNDPLQRWVWQDVIEFGNNEEISYEVGSTAGKGFFRLHSTGQSPPPGVSLEDWDADGDGLSNALELQLQTHPLHPDTSGDGIPDGWAHAHGLNPLANNAAGFFQGGGLTNPQAFQAGVQGHPAATLANLDGDSLDNEVDADPRERVIDWAPTCHPAFAAIELDVNDVEELLLDDFTESGSVLLTRIQNHAPVGRIVIDRNLVPHTFPHGATPTAGAPFVGYGPTLVGEKVAGARLVNGVVTDSLWDPLANTFATWQRPFGYDSDIRDERGGIYLGRNWLGLSPDGLRRSPNGDLLPGENLVQSWDARIEGNGNIVSDQGYWRKDPVSGALGNVRRFPATPSAVRSATLVQGSPAVEWHLVASQSGLMVAKGGGAFVQASGELKEVPVHGVTRQGWVTDTHQDRIRANGQWRPMVNLLGGGDYEEADLLDIMDTGLAIAKIRRTGQPLRLAILLPVEVVPDYNRDGKIDSADRGQVSDDNPFRWWVNDDDDEGEAAGGKKAKGDIPNNGTADHQDNVVDGMRDLVDFFPLHLDIETLLDTLPAPEHTYRLKHSQSALKFLEIPEIVPDGEPETDGAGSFIRSLNRAESLAGEALKTASSSGGNLTQAMLDALENGEGILLLEATKEATEPLQLEILKGSDSIATIDFPVRVSKVEDMYRHVDLRSIPTEYDGSAISAPASVNGTKTGDPGDPYPDELTNGKYFAFVHGYNVAQDKARGWHAETFKRLHQTGSKARYVGVVWQGDTGTDYHKAVFQAFQTGDQLTGAMNFVDGDLTIAAHSLGNMVVSQAVQNGGFAPERYYLLNAAVAREAYGGNIPAAERTMMIEDGTQLGNNGPHFRKWRDYDGAGQSRLLSPEWHTLFPANDNRSKLKWNASFGNATNLPLYNFYSPGDEVVRNPVDPTASAMALILKRGFDFSTYAWANQEYVKGGTSFVGNFMERKQGGWVYNYDPPDPPEEGDPVPPETFETGYFKDARNDFMSLRTYRKYTEAEARDELTRAALRAKPFFKPFLELGLFDAANGNALAGQPKVKYDLLARGLPALSYAAAANPVNGAQGNFDMEAQFRTDPQRWPLENHQSDEGGEDELWEGKWLHSDFKNVALSHVYKMFDQMIETGGLDQ